MSTVTKLITAAELLAMPKQDRLYELVQGELHMMAPAGGEHGMVEATLLALLHAFATPRKLGRVLPGDTGFILALNPDTVRSPDVAFISHERLVGNERPEGFFAVAPDLAVEIVSPSDRTYELDEKVQTWLQAGTRLVWVINPKPRTITVYAADQRPIILRAADQLDGGDVLPGFTIRVADLFA